MLNHRYCVESGERGQQMPTSWNVSSKGHKYDQRSELWREEDTKSVVLYMKFGLSSSHILFVLIQNSVKSSSVVSRRITHNTNYQSSGNSSHRLLDTYQSGWRPTERRMRQTYCQYSDRRPKSASELLR